MKTLLLAGLLLSSACFGPGYYRDPYPSRYDAPRYDHRYDRSNRADRSDRGRYRPHSRYRGDVTRRLPPGARIQRRGGETYARVGQRVLVWDEYRRGWVVVR